MAGKITNKLAREVMEALGMTLTSRPKHLKGVERVRPPEPTNIHPDIMSNKTPLVRLLHGTADTADFSELNVMPDSRQKAIHLTRNPDVASDYAGLFAEIPEVKPRVYSVLADPGRTLHSPWGLPNWWDPEYFEQVGKHENIPDLVKLSTMMDDSGNVGPLLKPLGYDTFSYGHFIPTLAKAKEGTAYIFPDASRFVPEWSLAGQKAKQMRGVLDLEPALPMSEWDPAELQFFMDNLKKRMK